MCVLRRWKGWLMWAQKTLLMSMPHNGKAEYFALYLHLERVSVAAGNHLVTVQYLLDAWGSAALVWICEHGPFLGVMHFCKSLLHCHWNVCFFFSGFVCFCLLDSALENKLPGTLQIAKICLEEQFCAQALPNVIVSVTASRTLWKTVSCTKCSDEQEPVCFWANVG